MRPTTLIAVAATTVSLLYVGFDAASSNNVGGMVGFICGAVVGVFAGIVVMAAVIAGARADSETQKIFDEQLPPNWKPPR